MNSKERSKAKVLQNIKERLSFFNVPKLLSINAILYKEGKVSVTDEILSLSKDSLLIIRSSAADEDGVLRSSAGEYDSILNIPSKNQSQITKGIDKVISSYEKKRLLHPEDEVIIQEMVLNTTMSGVIFTYDLNTGAPYYVVNYDDQSGVTDMVTSGNGEYANRTLYIHRNSIDKLKSERFIKLLQAVQELEQVMDSKFLDIEFALDTNLTPYLLQVRAITTQTNWNREASKRIDTTLQGVQSFVIERLKRVPGVYGETTVLGQMPDWNPVEMIGRAPRALSLSLYQTLITDHAWSDARAIMGYTIPTGQPLMVMLAGQPFIDTRLSFHSYLPNTIPFKIAEKVVDHWLDHLRMSPELHDKVEFDIAITAYSFDIDDKIENLIGDSLNDSEKIEFKQAHLEQTRRLVKGKNEDSLSNALNRIEVLDTRQREKNSDKLPPNIASLFAIVSDCIQYGTIPFAILARHGFIARTILHSLQNIGIITKSEMSQFQESIQTVASNLIDDMHALQLGELTNTKFMRRYGHLRPGTYDIMSHRYDQMSDISKGSVLPHCKDKVKAFKFSKIQQQQVNTLLIDNGFGNFSSDELLNYIQEAIIGREYGKFVFTRSVSSMLELIANFAEKNGLSRDEMSHVPLNSILNVVKSSSEKSIEEYFREISKQEEERHQVSVAIRLPQILTDSAGVHIIPFQVSHPNFITHKKVTAEILILHSKIDEISLKDKIIVIEGADPGFDWIFSQEIAGLITKYGGVNSHMAIRCAEFGIPAAIGCGEQRYEPLLKSTKAHLDCAAGLINLLH